MNKIWKGKNSNVVAEKSSRHHPKQVLQVNIPTDKPCWCHVTQEGVLSTALHLCGGLPTKPGPCKDEEAPDTPRWRDSLRNP